MGEKCRILLVDDDPNFLNGIRRALFSQRKVWDLAFAQTADQALALAQNSCFDVIVSDVNMPGKDGFQLLGSLRDHPATRDVPVIILTGSEDATSKRKALDLGATDLLNKPVSMEDLIARIWSVLRLKHYQDELKRQRTSLERMVAERTVELEASRLDIIWCLAKAGEFRDQETGNHIIRVGFFCQVLAEQLALQSEFIEMIFLASPLHDIGKIGIPDHILRKPAKLDPEERAIMEQHTLYGAEILQPETRRPNPLRAGRLVHHDFKADNPVLKMASTIALSHHERWDGAGYPHRLKGEDIPLVARITALADVYDALCSVRPYKASLPEDEVLAIMNREKNLHFDPMVYDAFLKRLDDFRRIRHDNLEQLAAAPAEPAPVAAEQEVG